MQKEAPFRPPRLAAGQLTSVLGVGEERKFLKQGKEVGGGGGVGRMS